MNRSNEVPIENKPRSSSSFYSHKMESGKIFSENNPRKAFTNMCRVCMREGIYSLFEKSPDIPNVLRLLTGIEMHPEDSFPKLLCKTCYILLRSAIFLQRTAQKSNQYFEQQQNKLYVIDENVVIDNESDSERTDYLSEKYEICQTNKNHKKTHAPRMFRIPKKPCPICHKPCRETMLEKHILTHKREKCCTVCDICGKTFSTAGTLKSHRLIHSNDLPFECTICPYKGRFPISLKVHMRKHTGERPYQCAQCPSRFITASNLKKHTLTHSTEEFKCNTCARIFKVKNSLETHIKAEHIGIIKQYESVCNICGKAFKYRKHLLKHGRRIHKRPKLTSGKFPCYLKLESKQEIDAGEVKQS